MPNTFVNFTPSLSVPQFPIESIDWHRNGTGSGEFPDETQNHPCLKSYWTMWSEPSGRQGTLVRKLPGTWKRSELIQGVVPNKEVLGIVRVCGA